MTQINSGFNEKSSMAAMVSAYRVGGATPEHTVTFPLCSRCADSQCSSRGSRDHVDLQDHLDHQSVILHTSALQILLPQNKKPSSLQGPSGGQGLPGEAGDPGQMVRLFLPFFSITPSLSISKRSFGFSGRTRSTGTRRTFRKTWAGCESLKLLKLTGFARTQEKSFEGRVNVLTKF